MPGDHGDNHPSVESIVTPCAASVPLPGTVGVSVLAVTLKLLISATGQLDRHRNCNFQLWQMALHASTDASLV